MGTDLLSQLSSDDQNEVDRLNDEIKQVVVGACANFLNISKSKIVLFFAMESVVTDICPTEFFGVYATTEVVY